MNHQKQLWEDGKAYEIEFWSRWFDAQGGQWAEDYRRRLEPNRSLEPTFISYLNVPEGGTCRILDVGAGPLTLLGTIWPGRTVEITAVDPLANDYNLMLEKANIVPPVRTQFGEVENLRRVFPEDYFDLVYMQNALDHSYDPLRGIREMLAVVKVGCSVVMSHFVNEAEREQYSGMHQWNFQWREDKFVIWNKESYVDLQEQLGGCATVSKEAHLNEDVVRIKILKNASVSRNKAKEFLRRFNIK